jgi:hypothetical protein
MRSLLVSVVVTFISAAPVLLPAIQAAGLENSISPRQPINAESASIRSVNNEGLPSTGPYYGADSNYPKRSSCWHHPTAIYHPEIYNYRYFFNIVGHETDSHCSNCRFYLPAAHLPEEILTPVPVPENQSSQTAVSARLSRSDQKKFNK